MTESVELQRQFDRVGDAIRLGHVLLPYRIWKLDPRPPRTPQEPVCR